MKGQRTDCYSFCISLRSDTFPSSCLRVGASLCGSTEGTNHFPQRQARPSALHPCCTPYATPPSTLITTPVTTSTFLAQPTTLFDQCPLHSSLLGPQALESRPFAMECTNSSPPLAANALSSTLTPPMTHYPTRAQSISEVW